MTSTGMSQKEYLKKYLSSGSDDKKKKKKKTKAKPAVNRLRIVDDDVDINNMRPLDDDELELYNLQEDAPQIAGIIDERPEEVKIKEKFGSKKWKVVADENDMGVKIIDKSKPQEVEKNVKNSLSYLIKENGDKDLSPSRKCEKNGDKTEQIFNTKQHDSEKLLAQRRADLDESPPRRNRKENEEAYVQNKNKRYDSDESPTRKSRKNNENNLPAQGSHHYQDSNESPPRRNHRLASENITHDRKHKYDSDESPPRRNHRLTSENITHDRKHKYDSDESPPRRSRNIDRDIVHQNRMKQKYVSPPKRNIPPDNASEHRRRQKYDSDASPPREKRLNKEDISNRNRVQKHDSDESPPRRIRKDNSENVQSQKRMHKYDSDESPPRKGKRSFSESPSRKEIHIRQTTKSDYRRSGYSPTGSRKRDSSSSFNPKGSNKHVEKKTRKSDSDESPSRRERRESFSPASRGGGRDAKFSQKRERRSVSPHSRNRKGIETKKVPRRTSRWGDAEDSLQSSQKNVSKTNVSSPIYSKEQSGATSYKEFERNDHKKDERNSLSERNVEPDVSPERKNKQLSKSAKKQMLDGRKAGLVGASELKEEIADLRHREKEMFEKMDASISGRGATAVMRDRKTGKKRNLEEEAREKQKKNEKQAEREAKYEQWGKGLKQVSDKAQKMEEDLYEMSKPLARYADDADLDRYLRDQEREGDPMLQYIRSKTKSEGKKSKPQYEGSFMPNRFGIRPGYRWDGVDRSNGYEKQWFETQNTKKAIEEEAYKWSTSDM